MFRDIQASNIIDLISAQKSQMHTKSDYTVHAIDTSKPKEPNHEAPWLETKMTTLW